MKAKSHLQRTAALSKAVMRTLMLTGKSIAHLRDEINEEYLHAEDEVKYITLYSFLMPPPSRKGRPRDVRYNLGAALMEWVEENQTNKQKTNNSKDKK